MEQLTLDQAAGDYGKQWHPELTGAAHTGFKAGAEWQKGQYKRILQLASFAANELDLLGATSLRDDIESELKRLRG